MFGRVSTETLLNLKQYVLKYGEHDAPFYFKALHINYDGDSYVIEEAVPDVLEAGQASFEDSFRVHYELRERIAKDNSDALKSFLVRLKRDTVTADYPGDSPELHYCVHIPLFQEEIWEQAKVFIDLIHQDVYPIPAVDVLGYCGDMADVFFPKDQVDYDACVKATSRTLEKMCAFNSKTGAIQHIIAIDNKQNSGISLKLNPQTLISILGEFALLSVEVYSALFDGLRDEKELCSMGISTMSIDRFYFVEYLLKRTYRFVLEREKVDVTEVDYNKMSQLSDTILAKWIHLMSELFQKEVKPRRQLGKDDQTIIVEILPVLEAQFADFVKEIDETSHSENLSIPEKRAFLAVFLGLDDPSLVNDVFNEDQLIINDLERESISIFIDSNNALLRREDTADGALLSLFLNPSEPTEEVFYPLDLIKKNRISIKHCVATIRELQKNEEKLKTQLANQAESEKCLIKNGVITYKGKTFKLLPTVEDPPLQEQYEPHAVSAKSIDLRGNFTSIKNQGSLGSCLSHSLVSIYEYFLRCNGLNAPDLSELFLYYNARSAEGKTSEDSGSNIQASMNSLASQGICSEKAWPYDEDKFDVCPPEEAYQDAATRKVKVSLNVALSVDDIKSALDDGLPVAVSVNVFESFTTGHGGFIPLPSADEKQSDEHGRHAMVICGFSEEDKVFIVRNSWGMEFGDGGYCYMPYSYFTNPDLTNWAAVIKEIVTAEDVPAGQTVTTQNKIFSIKPEKRAHVNFDHSDANIMLMVTQAGIVEQQDVLDHLLAEDKTLQAYYAKLKQQLIDRNLQTRLKDATINRLNLEANDLKQQKQQKEDEKSSELGTFDKGTLRKLIIGGIIILAITLGGFFAHKVVKSIQNTRKHNIEKFETKIDSLQGSIKAQEKALKKIDLQDTTGVRKKAEDNLASTNKKKTDAEKSLKKLEEKFKEWKKVSPKIWRYVGILDAIVLLAFGLVYYFRLRRRKEIEEEYNDVIERLGSQIDKLEDERDVTKVRFYISGFILTKLFELGDKLSERYNVMKSFQNNLITWHDSLAEDDSDADRGSHPTSVMLLDPKILDAYFESNKEAITEGLKLSDFLKGFELNENGILKLKLALEKAVIGKITSALDDFSIYRYFAREEKYPYLPPVENEHLINARLNELGRKAQVFQQLKVTAGALNPQGTIFIHLEDDELNRWSAIYPNSFSIRPNTQIIKSKGKIALTNFIQMNLVDLLFYEKK